MISCSFIRTPFVDNLVSRIHFLFFAGELASFRFSSFFVTKRAARFRRVALKKLLSVFAEQPRAFLGTFIIIPYPFAKINTILSNFVQIRPHLSKFVQPALESRKNKKIFTACPIPFLPRSVRSESLQRKSQAPNGTCCKEIWQKVGRKKCSTNKPPQSAGLKREKRK